MKKGGEPQTNGFDFNRGRKAQTLAMGSATAAPVTMLAVGFELVAFIAEAEGIATSSVTFKSCFGKRMTSIMNHFKGSQDFPRLRIGIGRQPGKMDPANFVIRHFNREETEELDFTFQNDLKAVRILVQENFNKAATFVNSSTKSLENL